MARLLSFFPNAQLVERSHAVAWDMKARPNLSKHVSNLDKMRLDPPTLKGYRRRKSSDSCPSYQCFFRLWHEPSTANMSQDERQRGNRRLLDLSENSRSQLGV